MRLSEMRELPRTAGDAARLHFFSEGHQRVGSSYPYSRILARNIYLSLAPENEFHPLQGGKQFLFQVFYCTCHTRKQCHRATYFGGTDERSAFLERLCGYQEFTYPDLLQEHGEEAFYEALKPPLLRFYEKNFGRTAKRQGDIYALEIPSWEDYARGWSLIFGNELQLKPVKRFEIYGRHRMAGVRSQTILEEMCDAICGDGRESRDFVFAQGRITHPQHDPLDLETAHLVMTSNLSD